MAAPPPHGGFRVLRTEHVTPSASGGRALSGHHAVPLTFLDAKWLHFNPVERVFFYRLVSGSGADDVDGMLSKLADSLSQALRTFYPLAGRIRLTPGETNRYFGNCLGPCRASMPKNGAAIDTVTDGGLRAWCAVGPALDQAVRREPGYWERWPERIIEACRDGAPFTVAGSPRFRVYGVDFGFGRPAKVEVVSVAKTGAMSVAGGRGCAGGIEVGIALPPDAMDSFRRCLDNVIACLSRQNDVI
uniref:Uncharacterized protein n=1 Tax=Oryza brachyantha TaxID=4533 RepID=J3LCW9_ORYBR